MGAFKKFNTQDVYVSTYTAHKNWTVSGSQYSEYGVLNIPAENKGPENYVVNASHTQKGYNKRLAYDSINHLYYNTFTDGEIITSSSFENFLQSTFDVSGSRNLKNIASIYSLSRDVYGTAIKPKSVQLKPSGEIEEYVSASSTETGIYHSNHIETVGKLYSSIPEGDIGSSANQGIIFDDEEVTGVVQTMIDDGEGNLVQKSSIDSVESTKKVGNVIYPQGQIIITDEIIAQYYSNYIDGELKWKSTQPIYTYNYHCKMKENEFTHTFNPSALSGSNGDVSENVGGEEFSPYFTTVGLYNDSNELIAVAKTGQAIPIPKDTDMTVVVKLDI